MHKWKHLMKALMAVLASFAVCGIVYVVVLDDGGEEPGAAERDGVFVTAGPVQTHLIQGDGVAWYVKINNVQYEVSEDDWCWVDNNQRADVELYYLPDDDIYYIVPL